MSFSRNLAVLVFGSIAGVCGCTTEDAAPKIERVILISVDTLRADALGAYSTAVAEAGTTPNLDRFASESLVFADTLAPAPSTARSHKSILYSIYPSLHKTHKDHVPIETGDSPLEILQDEGFTTAAIVDGGQLSRSLGFSRGFDDYIELPDHYGNRPLESASHMVTEALKWIDANGDDPFFLFLHTYQPHCPYDPPGGVNGAAAVDYRGTIVPSDSCRPSTPLDRDDFAYLRALYRAEVAFVDRCFGELMAELDERGILDTSIIVFLSDHGESIGERGKLGHGQLYDVQLRVPFFWRIPGNAPARIEGPASTIDFMPTLFSLLDLEAPYMFQGEDLTPSFDGATLLDPSRPRIAESGKGSVTVGRWKVVFRHGKGTSGELYDLATDPEERTDLAERHPRRVVQLRAAYDAVMSAGAALGDRFRENLHGTRLDDATRQQLEALGYLVPGADGASDARDDD